MGFFELRDRLAGGDGDNWDIFDTTPVNEHNGGFTFGYTIKNETDPGAV